MSDARIDDLKGHISDEEWLSFLRHHPVGKVEAAYSEIKTLRAENAELKRAVKTAVFADSAENEALRAENARLREALKPFAEVGECESASFSYHFIRAARAAMGESDE